MNAHRLDDLLRTTKVPAADAQQRNAHIARAVMAFRAAPHEELTGELSRFTALREWLRAHPFSMGALSSAMCCVALYATVLLPTATHNPAARDQQVLQHMESVFGGSLQAVVFNGENPEVLLRDHAQDTTQAQPLVLEINSGGRTTKVMSFSGEKLSLSVNGQQLTFEVLISGDGKVLLVSENGAWELRGTTQIDRATHITGYAL